MDQELKVYIALVQFPAPMLGSSTTTYNSSSGTIIPWHSWDCGHIHRPTTQTKLKIIKNFQKLIYYGKSLWKSQSFN